MSYLQTNPKYSAPFIDFVNKKYFSFKSLIINSLRSAHVEASDKLSIYSASNAKFLRTRILYHLLGAHLISGSQATRERQHEAQSQVPKVVEF